MLKREQAEVFLCRERRSHVAYKQRGAAIRYKAEPYCPKKIQASMSLSWRRVVIVASMVLQRLRGGRHNNAEGIVRSGTFSQGHGSLRTSYIQYKRYTIIGPSSMRMTDKDRRRTRQYPEDKEPYGDEGKSQVVLVCVVAWARRVERISSNFSRAPCFLPSFFVPHN